MKDYVFNGDYYGTLDPKGNFNSMGQDIIVQKVEKLLENNDIYLTVDFYVGDIIQTIRCKSSELQRKLSAAGYITAGNHSNPVYESIQDQGIQNKVEYIHGEIGWGMHDEQCIFKDYFKGYKAIGIDSDYCGNVDIKPHGEISIFRRDYNKIIYGNTELEASIEQAEKEVEDLRQAWTGKSKRSKQRQR